MDLKFMIMNKEQITYVDGKPHIKCGMVMLYTNQESELCLSFEENSFGNLTDKKLVKIDSACYNLSNIKNINSIIIISMILPFIQIRLCKC